MVKLKFPKFLNRARGMEQLNKIHQPMGINLVGVGDEEFKLLIKSNKTFAKTLTKNLIKFVGAGVLTGGALIAMQGLQTARTGCFRYEFSGGKLISHCKVASCSCGSNIGSDKRFVSICSPDVIEPVQRIPSKDITKSGCIHCDYSAAPTSVEYLNPDTVPDGVVYVCEAPTLVEVYSEVVGATVGKAEHLLEDTFSIFTDVLRWVLAALPVVGLIVVGIILIKIFKRLKNDQV